MKLRRITTHGNWIPEIDGLRFVAITATLLVHILGETYHHANQIFPPEYQNRVGTFIDHGDRGVLLFFAISGFILAQPFLRQRLLNGQPVSVKAFFRRRLTRLEPPYILSLLIYGGAIAVSQHRFWSLIPSLFTHIVYLRNFLHVETFNFVTWSLEVEVQFYILAPLLGLLYAIRPTTLRRGIIIAMILASALVRANMHGHITWNLPGQLQFFLVAFFLQTSALHAPNLLPAVGGILSALLYGSRSLLLQLAISTTPCPLSSFSPTSPPSTAPSLARYSALRGSLSREVCATPSTSCTCSSSPPPSASHAALSFLPA